LFIHAVIRQYFFSVAWQPLVDQSLLIVEASRSHPGTPYSVGLHWTNDHPDTEMTWQHNIHKTHPCPPAGFEPATPASELPKNHALVRAATGIGIRQYTLHKPKTKSSTI
jgi:hypothetical protein